METVRVFFVKEGRLKYISHLDVTRCLSRVFNRCGLPIWYTQGYNPHPYLTFALPLPLGVDSRCESFDFRLTDATDYQTVQDRLNAALPEDLRVLRAAAPVYGPEAICWADYRLTFRDGDTAVAEQLQRFLAEPHLPVIKKTKKGEQQVDLKEKMTVLEPHAGNRGFLRTAGAGALLDGARADCYPDRRFFAVLLIFCLHYRLRYDIIIRHENCDRLNRRRF